MRTWRPLHRGLMIVEPRTGAGRTQSGIYVTPGLYNRDTTRRTRMVGDVLTTYACENVKPDDVVLFRYGSDHTVVDSHGEAHTFIHERQVLAVK